MQIVSTGDNLHEMLNSIFWKKKKKKKKSQKSIIMSAENFIQHAKHFLCTYYIFISYYDKWNNSI